MAKPQQVCKGVLVFQQAAQGAGLPRGPFESHCYGIASTNSTQLDLEAHHEATRTAHMQPHAQGMAHYMHSLTCVGVGTYQHQPSTPQGEIPPPACIGLEFLRYGQAAMQHRQHASSSSPVHTLPDTADELPGLPVPQYHQQQQQQQQQHMSVAPEQQATAASSPAAAAGRESRASAADEEQQPRTLFERLQAVHREASERLEGQDPMWFANAWARRAQLNLASMKRMAGQLVDAARADLGLGPEGSDEERSP